MATASKKPGKTPAKKSGAKAPAARKAAAKAAPKGKSAPKAAPKASAKPAEPMKPIGAPLSKQGLVATVAERAAADLRTVKSVIASLEETIIASLHKKGARAFTWPGLFKATTVIVPAKPARKGINPFTKMEQMFAAKPATTKVKVRVLKKAQDAVK